MGLHDFTTKEVLNKVLLDSSGNAVDAFSHTTQEALNAALDSANSRLNVSLEGGTISGDVTITGDLTVSGGGNTFAYNEVVTGDMIINRDASGDSAENGVGLYVDFDRTVAASGTAAHNDIGINLDVNSASLGTSSVIGMDIDVVGATSGTHTATGLTVNVSGSDTNYAALFNGGNVGIGTTSPLAALHVEGQDINHSNASGNALFNFFPASSSNAYIDVETAGSDLHLRTSSTSRIVIQSGGNVGIGVTAPSAKIDIADSGMLALLGSSSGTTRADATSKVARVGVVHYTNAQEPVGFLYGQSTASKNQIGIGGGSSTFNAATEINFWTAANQTTTTGTNRMHIDSSGNVGIGVTPTNAARLQLQGSTALNNTLQLGNYGVQGGRIASEGSLFITMDATDEDSSQGQGIYFGEGGIDSQDSVMMTILQTGKVGIGTASPSDYHANADDLVIATSGSTGITIVSGTTSEGNIFFADGTSGSAEYAGFVQCLHGSSNLLKLGVNGENKLILDINSRISLSNNDTSGTDGQDSTSGNTIFGYLAGDGLDGTSNAGYNNVFMGHKSGNSITTGDGNVIIGNLAGNNTTDVDNAVIVGNYAGQGVMSNLANGTVAVGYFALQSLTSGGSNTAVGYLALTGHTTGGANVALGHGALKGTAGTTASTSSNNIAIGANALGGDWNDSAASNYNIAIGGDSQDGVLNEAIGNVSMGYDGLGALTSGDYNIGLGHNSANVITTGSNNTILGANSDPSANSATNQTTVGYGVTGVADNSVTLGNASVTDVYMSQDSGAYVHSQNVTNHVSNTMSAPYYRFDGSNDDITVADSAHLSFGDGNTDIPFSISAWINMEDATNFPIASKGVYNSTGEWLFGTDGSDLLKFQLHDESVADTFEKASTTALTAYQGKWMHVAATYSGVGGTSANAGIKLYVNGVSQSLTLAGGGTYVAMENLTAAVHIGRYDSDYAQGSIAGVKIHNHELSATEVKEDYSGASVPFKYVYANNTLLNTGTAANTGSFDTFGSASLAGYSASNSSASGTKAVAILMTGANLKKGDYIGLTINHTTFANVTVTGWKIGESAGGGNSYTNTQVGVGSGISHTTNLVTMDSIANPYLRITYSTASNTDIVAADIKLIRVGAVAEYDGSGAGAHRWGDKSGNSLHGTVGAGTGDSTAPTLENTPYDSGTEYEEGTWTPIVKDYGDPLVAFTAGTGNSGTYTKVGRMVTCNAFVTTSADNSASGSIAIHGLPFAQVSGSDTAVTFGNYEQLAITAETSINGTIYDTNQFIGLYVADGAGGSTNMSVAEWSPDGRTYLSVTYFV